MIGTGIGISIASGGHMPQLKSPPTITNVSVSPASGPGGTTFTASVMASGHPPLRIRYQWRLDGTDIPGATGVSHIASAGGALSVVATVRNNEGSDGGESVAATVFPALSAPEVMEARIQPEAAFIGDRLTTIAFARGIPTPELKFQWLSDGVAIPGATEASHVAVSPGAVTVRVTAFNSEGLDSAESRAIVIAADPVVPVIASAAVSPATGRVGTIFAATQDVTGDPDPVVTYQWRLDGADVPGATEKTFLAVAEGLLSVRVTASNSEGSTSLETAAVVIAPALAKPVITGTVITPASGRTGDTFTASASLSGEPTPSRNHQWMLNGVAIPDATRASHVAASIGDLSVVVTATNSEGSYTSESAPAAVRPAMDRALIGTLNDRSYSVDSGTRFYNIASTTTGTQPITFHMLPKVVSAGIVNNGDGTYGRRALTAGHPVPATTTEWLLDGSPVGGETGDTIDASGLSGDLTVRITAANIHGSDTLESAAETLAAAVNPVHLATMMSGTNSGVTSYVATNPAYSIGDLVVVAVRVDRGTSTTVGMTAPNGETVTTVRAQLDTGDTGTGSTSMALYWYIATAVRSSGANITCTSSAAEQFSVSVSVFDAGTFDATTPLANTASGSATGLTPTANATSPATTATETGGMALFFAGVDIETVATTPSGWTELGKNDIGAIGGYVGKRNAFTTAGENIAAATFPLANPSLWVGVTAIVNPR